MTILFACLILTATSNDREKETVKYQLSGRNMIIEASQSSANLEGNSGNCRTNRSRE